MSASVAAARALVEGLVAAGVRDLVLCPGSRSAPLAYAAHAAEQAGALRLHVRHDERGAAFVALGCAAADRRPAAVVTTSGTAVANLHPAVLEAHHAGVPLLVLTADRPHRLRGTWANQTSHLQAGLFGGAPVATRDIQAPEVRAAGGSAVHEWFSIGIEAARTAVEGTPGRGRGGPVHLNLAFDEPLTPQALEPWPAGTHGPPGSRAGSRRADTVLLDRGPRTLVVAGDRAGVEARRLAEAAGWPLLAEPTSGAKGGDHRIGAYRLVLGRTGFGDRVERVVVFGHPTVSRPVTRLLARVDVELVQVVRSVDEPGPERHARRVVGHVEAAGDPGADSSWLEQWVAAGRVAERAVDEVLDGWPVLTGPLLAREVAHATGAGDALVVAASNPVRDLDLVAPAPDGVLVLANRGLAGIDGTIGTAVGVAAAAGRPTRLLVGDLAFLHDHGSLALPVGERDRLRLQVVVLNDDGGGIFGLIEHADHPSSFERVFGTPHGADLASLCAAVGVPHRRVNEKAELATVLADVPLGISVVEVRADRGSLRPLHDALRTAVVGPDPG